MENSGLMFMYNTDFSYSHSLQLLLDQSLLPPLPGLRLKLVTQINSSPSYFCNFPYLRKHKTSPHLPFFLLQSQDKSEAVLILQFSSFLLFKQQQRQIIINLCLTPFKSVLLNYQSSFITGCISLQMNQKLNPALASLPSASNQPPSFELPCSFPSDCPPRGRKYLFYISELHS